MLRINLTKFKYLFLLLSIAGVVLLYNSILWRDLVEFILKTQLQLHKLLNEQVMLISQQPENYGFSLIVVSFIYGVFHALGPGHGKAIIVSYLASNPLSKLDSCLLALTAAIFQAMTAILLVTILSLLLKNKYMQLEVNANQLTLVGYSLLLLLGLFIAVKSLKQLFNTSSKNIGCSCCSSKVVIEQKKMSQLLIVALGIGLRPCSGALIILVSSSILGIYSYGILGTLAMSLGTAVCTCLIALASLYARNLLNKLLTIYTNTKHQRNYGLYVQLLGSIVIILLAWSLINTNKILSNPLLTN